MYTKKALQILADIQDLNEYDNYRSYYHDGKYIVTNGHIAAVLTEKPNTNMLVFDEWSANSDTLYKQIIRERDARRILSGTQYKVKELEETVRKWRKWQKLSPKNSRTTPIVRIDGDDSFGTRGEVYVNAKYLMWAIDIIGRKTAKIWFGRAEGFYWPTIMVSEGLYSKNYVIVLPVNTDKMYGKELIPQGDELVFAWDVQ